MRHVKINFRVKNDHGTHRTWKVYTTQRIPGRKTPAQIHIGYINEYLPIPDHVRDKITDKLQDKWEASFYTRDVGIDWEDAEEKLQKKADKIKTTFPNRRSKSQLAESAILFLLMHRGKHYSIEHIAANAGLSEPFTKFIVAKMIDKGYAELREHPGNRRPYIRLSTEFEITPLGTQYLKDNYPEAAKLVLEKSPTK